MKNSSLYLAILLALGWITATHAQLVEAQDFNSSGDVTFTVTLTTAGPIDVLADSTGSLVLKIDGTEVAVGQNYNNYITSLDYVTSTNLAAGSHTIALTGGGTGTNTINYNGAATLLAPNEPPSGNSSAIATLDSEVSSLQTSESADSSLINTLQSEQTSQAAEISSLQTDEATDASNIAALQNQLTTVQNTLQGEIATNASAITALQNRVANDETTAAQQESQITALQNQSGDNSSAIETLQQQEAATAAQQQTDESKLTTLQSQEDTDKTTLTNLQTQLADDQAMQAAENANLQKQITALQGAPSSTLSFQNQINSVNRSANLTRMLTYAGMGIGMAALGTGIGAIVSEDDSSDSASSSSASSDSSASDSSSDSSSTDPKATR